jgi:hypothetical protein
MSRFSIVLVALVACGTRNPTADSLTPRTRVAVSVWSTPQGLTAAGIVAERPSTAAESESATNDPGGVDCQNGLDASGKPCDGGPAANPDDGSAEVAAAKSGDGQVVVPRGMLQASGGAGFNGLGMTIVHGSRLPDGPAVRFIGSLDSTNRFVAVATRTSAASTGRLLGSVESVARGQAGGISLRILGQTVHARGDLPLNLVESVEAASEQDSDGVTCEQTADNQGDNSGCAPPHP